MAVRATGYRGKQNQPLPAFFAPFGRALQRIETIFLLVSFIADLTAPWHGAS
jgi:hypothetical protein